VDRSSRINFTKKQIAYLMEKTGSEDPNEAVEVFAVILQREHIDPTKMIAYLNKLMAKDGV
jgi:hypothetical protein